MMMVHEIKNTSGKIDYEIKWQFLRLTRIFRELCFHTYTHDHKGSLLALGRSIRQSVSLC